ncbi:MAG: stage II sporulation protein M [Candidatus Aenigmarchaeota archaeon]|nr:stage II sporulation protein M [Candidatus Aenigmarchaeota archaeon]
MLETLWLREEYKDNFLYIFLFGLIFTIVSAFVTKIVFPSYEGLVSVFLVSLIGAYPMIRYLRKKEKDEMLKRLNEEKLLKRHGDELAIYLSFFLGVVFGFIVSAYVLPSSYFEIQENVISGIKSSVSGDIVNNTLLYSILSNNLWVFTLTFFISFLFSAGMIFILVWNASVLGVFLARTSEDIYHMHLLMLSYLPHGILEISAYILAGISGALLSYQIDFYFAKGPYRKSAVIRVLKDSIILLMSGLGFLLLAGIVEVL